MSAAAGNATAGAYKNLINQFKKVAFIGPKPPLNYNLHQMVPSPMSTRTLRDLDSSMHLTEKKSNRYDSLYKNEKIPLPSVLTRHCVTPVSSLMGESALGKVIGFRIEVKGRVGSRSMRRAVNYGVLDSGKIGPLTGTMVDFGKSSYVTKRGESGVKVWIAYGHK